MWLKPLSLSTMFLVMALGWNIQAEVFITVLNIFNHDNKNFKLETDNFEKGQLMGKLFQANFMYTLSCYCETKRKLKNLHGR